MLTPFRFVEGFVSMPTAQPHRDFSLDLFKSLLVLGMVYCHTVQLAIAEPTGIEKTAALAIKLISFSGFMFAYGVGVGLSKSGTRRTFSVLALSRVGQIYVAYFVSSIAYLVLVSDHTFDWLTLVRIATMSYLEPFSEFLASFFVLGLVSTYLRREVKWVVDTPAVLAVILLLGLLSTFVSINSENIPLLSTLIGNTAFATFPICAYLIWFLAGVKFARRGMKIDAVVLMLALAGTASMGIWIAATRSLPARFPPNYLWVIGSSLPLLIYIFASRQISGRFPNASWLTLPGRYALSVLVVSSLFLFSANAAGPWDLPLFAGLAISLLLTFSIVLARQAVDRVATRRQSATRQSLS